MKIKADSQGQIQCRAVIKMDHYFHCLIKGQPLSKEKKPSKMKTKKSNRAEKVPKLPKKATEENTRKTKSKKNHSGHKNKPSMTPRKYTRK
jgi:hypothetical protein